MKRPNITPGEWHLGKRAGAEHGAIYGEKGEEVALPLGFFMEDAEAKANARAIASVPALLAAMEDLIPFADVDLEPDELTVEVPIEKLMKLKFALQDAGYTFD